MKRVNDSNISTAAMVVMVSMILGRLTGFLRETVLSWKVGLSWVQDAYVAAFTVPDIMNVLLVGGMISAALVPFLSGKVEKGEEKKGWTAASTFINMTLVALAVICALGIIFADMIIPVVAPGFNNSSPQTKELAVKLSRVLFPSVFFIMLAGICNGVLNSYKKFAAAAFGPSVYNMGCAVSIYLFADTDPRSMIKAAVFVSLSSFGYFLLQFAFSMKKFRYYWMAIEPADPDFRKLFGHAVPSLLNSVTAQLNTVIATAFVTLIAVEGSLAAFRNANTLWQMPHGIFAVGIGTAVLPSLSGKYAKGEYEEYKTLLMKSLTSVLFFAIPSAAGFLVLREQIVRAVFEWGGRFTEKDVPVVAAILACFCISMVTHSTVTIMNRAYYAAQDTRTPLVAGLISVMLNLVLGYVFYRYTDLGAAGIALSYSLVSLVNSAVLLLFMKKKKNGVKTGELAGFLSRAVPSAALMGAVLWSMQKILPYPDRKVLQLVFLAAEIIAGCVLYIIMMLFFKSQDARYLVNNIKQRLKM